MIVGARGYRTYALATSATLVFYQRVSIDKYTYGRSHRLYQKMSIDKSTCGRSHRLYQKMSIDMVGRNVQSVDTMEM